MAQTIRSKAARKDLMKRYNMVMFLRNLCNGQISSYENKDYIGDKHITVEEE